MTIELFYMKKEGLVSMRYIYIAYQSLRLKRSCVEPNKQDVLFCIFSAL